MNKKINSKKIGFGSLCLQKQSDNKNISAHREAIYATSAFTFDNTEHAMRIVSDPRSGFLYGRWNNPTVQAAANAINALETFNSEKEESITATTLLFSSGMSAISALFLSCVKPGRKILTQNQLYGGTQELLDKMLTPLHIENQSIDLKDGQAVSKAIKMNDDIDLIYVETPSNPMIRCFDIKMLSDIAKRHGVKLAVDNTFATPWNQRPLTMGADFVVHSTTKFLNGHGNALGGAIVGSDVEFMLSRVWEQIKLHGSNANPFDSWLMLNGIKTLDVRMERHCSNALKIASFLKKHKAVSKVHYAGLKDHPDHKIATKQMRTAGAVLSFELKDGLKAGVKCMNKVKLCTLATTLGTVDTLIQHPASMTHFPISGADRLKMGITDGLVRLSVGIENADDIMADLDQALTH